MENDCPPSGQSVSNSLLIVGATARAAAQSARRAGYSVWAADLFADEDLRAAATAVQIGAYPHGLIDAVRAAPPGDWLYTGALENHPELLETLAAERTLLGNSAEVVRRVRDPFTLAAALSAAEISVPRVARIEERRAPECRWLRKRLRSAGGTQIEFAPSPPAEAADAKPAKRSSHSAAESAYYAQEFIAGASCSGLFVGVSNDSAPATAHLLGVTWQLIGRAYAAAQPFQYAGSIGPLTLAAADAQAWNRVGQALVDAFQLVGLFGVDAIVQSRARSIAIWPVEVNPRYTASVEVLERANGFDAIRAHAAACRGAVRAGTGAEGTLGNAPSAGELLRLAAERAGFVASESGLFGKLIVYSSRGGVVAPEFSQWAAAQNAGAAWPVVADLPRPLSAIEPAAPIATVFAQGSTVQAVEALLLRRAEQVRAGVHPA
ncbi:MAG TPA: ATP-grasp domain-containing protein [Pirellulales bacterium]|nr:ATP-grasp domain-containing protein [Pirellulales bacterium]